MSMSLFLIIIGIILLLLNSALLVYLSRLNKEVSSLQRVQKEQEAQNSLMIEAVEEGQKKIMLRKNFIRLLSVSERTAEVLNEFEEKQNRWMVLANEDAQLTERDKTASRAISSRIHKKLGLIEAEQFYLKEQLILKREDLENLLVEFNEEYLQTVYGDFAPLEIYEAELDKMKSSLQRSYYLMGKVITEDEAGEIHSAEIGQAAGVFKNNGDFIKRQVLDNKQAGIK